MQTSVSNSVVEEQRIEKPARRQTFSCLETQVLCGDFNSLPVSQTSWLPQVLHLCLEDQWTTWDITVSPSSSLIALLLLSGIACFLFSRGQDSSSLRRMSCSIKTQERILAFVKNECALLTTPAASPHTLELPSGPSRLSDWLRRFLIFSVDLVRKVN